MANTRMNFKTTEMQFEMEISPDLSDSLVIKIIAQQTSLNRAIMEP